MCTKSMVDPGDIDLDLLTYFLTNHDFLICVQIYILVSMVDLDDPDLLTYFLSEKDRKTIESNAERLFYGTLYNE